MARISCSSATGRLAPACPANVAGALAKVTGSAVGSIGRGSEASAGVKSNGPATHLFPVRRKQKQTIQHKRMRDAAALRERVDLVHRQRYDFHLLIRIPVQFSAALRTLDQHKV